MDTLKELILRGRFIMANAPERLNLFKCVNGKRNTEELARFTKRHINSVRRDLNKLADSGLVKPRMKKDEPFKKNGFPVYEKVPLARSISLRYFSRPTRLPTYKGTNLEPTNKGIKRFDGTNIPNPLPIPTEEEILDFAREGENQIHEFKGQGIDARKITREIAAMLNTRQGGIIFYGIDNDGNIEGSDVSQQKLDQPLQNSIRNSISPAATIPLHTVQVMGSSIIVIAVPPWNKKEVYQFDGRILIRRGTNVFVAKPEEVRRLHSGMYVV
jgi:predicted HTH transcriptional regulator